MALLQSPSLGIRRLYHCGREAKGELVCHELRI